MRYLLLALPLALSACVSDRNLSDYICTHQVATRLEAQAALRAADAIKDATARQAAIDAANATLVLVEACGPVG